MTNNLVEFASFEIIRHYRAATGSDINSLYFNNVISILSYDLQAKGIKLRAPHCWYLSGDEVVRAAMPKQVRWQQAEEEVTKMWWEGGPPETIREQERTIIKGLAQAVVEEYAFQDDCRTIMVRAHVHAPFSFQREYLMLRWAIADMTDPSLKAKDDGALILEKLNAAMDSFPREDFPELVPCIGPFRTVVTSLLETHELDHATVSAVADDFWRLFCQFLRPHGRAHDDVPNAIRGEWIRDLEWEPLVYLDLLSDQALAMVAHGLAPERTDLLAIAEKRRQELADLDRMIDDFAARMREESDQ